MNNGFIKIYRKMTEWRWWGNCYGMAIWLYILVNANWKDGYWHGVECKRGEFITSKSKIAEELGVNRRTVSHWLNVFEKDGQIDVTCTRSYTKITVIKYDIFQGQELSSAQPTAQPDAQPSTQQTAQPTAHNRRSKEDKEIKKVRNREGFRSPSLPEVERYFKEHGYKAEPFPFWEYYNRREWKDQNGRQLDWMLKAGDWEAREKQICKNEERIVISDPFKKHNEDDTGEWWEGLLDGK